MLNENLMHRMLIRRVLVLLFLSAALPARSEDLPETIGPSSRRTALVISEIMYRPPAHPQELNLEYIEIYNSQPWFHDISGFRIRGDIEFTFPTNTVLEAQAYLVVAKAPAHIQQACQISNVLGPYAGQLPGESGRIRLEHRSGAILLEVNYLHRTPWPLGASGTGHSLVLIRPSLGEGRAEAWSRSAWIGGSPGKAEPNRPLPSVVINEFGIQSGASTFIELFNRSTSPVDLSGVILTDEFGQNKFRIPNGSSLAPGHYLTCSAQDHGFILKTGETIYLVNSNRTAILDAACCDAPIPGQSTGRHPNGSGAFRQLVVPTPGTGNAWLRIEPVVINEIMYDPLSGDSRDEYIELHNWSEQSMDLSGWTISDGISYTFPVQTTLQPKSFLVVAKDPGRMRANYPHLTGSQVFGHYSGALANGGERVALSRPGFSPAEMVLVDEVTYGTGGRWGRWAHGGGSSLELIHPFTDHQSPDSWADSDESGKAPWTLVEGSGVLTNYGATAGALNSVNLILMGAGECLLDDVEVLKVGQQNVVSNSTFEAGLGGWIGQGNHERISLQATGREGPSLRLASTGRGDPGPNRLIGKLYSNLTRGQTATLRAQARWLRGSPDLLIRIPGNYLEACGRLTVPGNLGSPGMPNSRFVPNPSPAILQVRHAPVLPKAGQSIRVEAQVTDPQGAGDLLAWYRLDPSTNYTALPLNDLGVAGDPLEGDGIYSGEIPGQAAGTLVAFYVTATESPESSIRSIYPANAPSRECLARVGETTSTNQFGTYRLWLTRATSERWARREITSNDPLEVTFVYGDSRIIYGAGAYYAGSKFNPSYDSPTGRPCDYSLVFPDDDLLLGATDFRISWPGNLNSGTDATLQAEQTCFNLVEELGLPFNHRRHVNFYVNGMRRNALLEDAQRPNGDFIDQWFPDDNQGDLHKIQVHYEPNDDRARAFSAVRRAGLARVRLPEGINRLPHYRWNWPKRAVKTSINDYDSLFQLIDTANLAETNGYTLQMESLVDVEEWMSIFAAEHIVGNWDSFGYSDGSNMYFYKPSRGKWRLCIWDMDLGLDQFSDGPATSLFVMRNGFGNLQSDAMTQRFFNHPRFRRAYLRALDKGVKEIAPRLAALVNARHSAFVRNGISAANPSSILNYLTNRRNYVMGQLAKFEAPFAISTNRMVTTNSLATLAGTAPYAVDSIRINSAQCALEWLTPTNWITQVRLTAVTNQLHITACSPDGMPLSQLSTEARVVYAGADPLLEPRLVINEWMAANTKTLADPADGDYEDWIEIYNPNDWPVDLMGYRITDNTNNPAKFAFPAGATIAPRGYLLLWADEEASQMSQSGPIHLNFKLSQTGEMVALYGPSGKLLDLVQFAAQARDVSAGRAADGDTADFGPLPTPTPGQANSIPDEALRLSCVKSVPGYLTLRWRAAPGLAYRLEYKTDLNQTSWMQSHRIVPESDQAVLQVPLENGLPRFYRVQVVR